MGTTVSGTYGRLVQVVGGLYYDGNGNLLDLGADGLQGPQGPTGADGLQGPQGATGADGVAGSFNGDVATFSSITATNSSFINVYIETGLTMSSGATINFDNGSFIGTGLTGINGIALNSENYEWKWEAGEAYLTTLSGNIVELKQYARAIPLENDDVTKGFSSGSYWLTLGGQIYQCQDATEGAAVWVSAEDYGNLQLVTDNGATTTNSITADGGFITTWELGSFQASPNGFDYNKSQIVDDEERSINLVGNCETGFQMNYTNATTAIQSYIYNKNDVTLGINQTIDDVLVSNTVTVLPTDTTFTKEIKVPKVFLLDGENSTYSSLVLNDNSLTFRDEADVAQIAFEPGSLGFINSDNHYANFNSNGLLSDSRSYTLPDASGTIALTSQIPTSLDELSDVVITGATAGQVLQYNGTNWINSSSIQSQIDSLVELNFLRQNVGYIQPSGLVNVQPSFNVSPNISSWALVLSGNTATGGIGGFVRFDTTATAGTLAFRRGSFGIILGGYQFEYTQKVRFQTNLTGQRGLWGLSAGYSFASPTNVEPNTNINVVGVCQLSTSTNLHILHNDGTGTATTVDLGANYPCNTNIYTYYIRIKRTTADYTITVERLTNSDNTTISTIYTTSTNIPAIGVASFSPINYITNNAQSATASYFDGGCIAKITHQ